MRVKVQSLERLRNNPRVYQLIINPHEVRVYRSHGNWAYVRDFINVIDNETIVYDNALLVGDGHRFIYDFCIEENII